MITGDLVRHHTDDSSLVVVMKIGTLPRDKMRAKILWLDEDSGMIETYPIDELVITSSVEHESR